MVRHEAAEALGGIGTPEVLPHLKEWMVRGDSPRVVQESCQVAIDMWEVRDLLSKHLGIRYLITLMADLVGPFAFVSLRRHQYENSDQFQYADGLEKVQALQVGA